MFTSVAGNTTK